jgi:hypothetical protein
VAPTSVDPESVDCSGLIFVAVKTVQMRIPILRASVSDQSHVYAIASGVTSVPT